MLTRATVCCALAGVLLLLPGSPALAQTTIEIDGDLDDWSSEMQLDVAPNREIVTWHEDPDGPWEPADPDDLEYMVDLNFSDLYATDDEDFLYLRIDMNERADIRRVWENEEMYPANQGINLYLSTDPDLFQDFADTTGNTWGWYENGYDFLVPLYPLDEAYEDTTGFQMPISEHTQETNEWAYGIYERRPDVGARIAWNEDYNVVEVAVPKSVILQPQNLPDFEGSDYVAIMLFAQSENTRQENPWWSQRVANNDQVRGFFYTYEAEWSGEDPVITSTEGDELVRTFKLEQNFPNPFNPSTNIRFSLESASHVRIDVFDVTGRHVATVKDGTLASGSHTVSFDAESLTSGAYLYRLTAGDQTDIRLMTLLK